MKGRIKLELWTWGSLHGPSFEGLETHYIIFLFLLGKKVKHYTGINKSLPYPTSDIFCFKYYSKNWYFNNTTIFWNSTYKRAISFSQILQFQQEINESMNKLSVSYICVKCIDLHLMSATNCNQMEAQLRCTLLKTIQTVWNKFIPRCASFCRRSKYALEARVGFSFDPLKLFWRDESSLRRKRVSHSIWQWVSIYKICILGLLENCWKFQILSFLFFCFYIINIILISYYYHINSILISY